MIRLGYVYDNLMVNVQPRNTKLADRCRRIIAAAAGVSQEEAARLLDASGGVVKTAIVMSRRGIPRDQAEQLIERAGGRISVALGL
jgi:N-acetylmuramic acid 6-phosphate etherase